ncbi:hypothetical protein BDN72DRAFT_829558 [Pluteus cervinus]|uniref:Uncharacterized protein n=1 Tax=Pluteus cervinus TaxID=181527 RepID=A0ACD2ZZ05_9AGAR|nr:hypothetical protein BDN72DRAFT_829558 [Pluteus cervinus]
MQPEIPENKRHHRFFIAEEFITLQIDEVYFNLPTFILKKHSKKLEKLIADQTETDPEYFAPLVQGVSAVDLERFLAILFPAEYGRYDATSFDEWASILKVSHQWEFESIFKLALEKIELVSSPVDKVVIGKAYDIPEWATEARVLLCRREEPITLEEALRMGIEEAMSISTTRHRIRSSEVRPGMQDSTIRSLLSGERDKENLDAAADSEVTSPPDASHGAPLGSTTTLGETPVENAPVVNKDPRLSRGLELRLQLISLRNRLGLLNGHGTRNPAQLNSASLAESEDVETQMDNLEEEYRRLYTNIREICSNTYLMIQKTINAESEVLAQLTQCLHPYSTLKTLMIRFPLFSTKDGIRRRPHQITLDVLNRYGMQYTTDAATGEIEVTIPS